MQKEGFCLEKKKIAYLGPEASFSHEAAQKMFDNATFLPKKSISEVFSSLDLKKADVGVVPIENSTGGSVSYTMDELVHGNYFINSELYLAVKQCFMSNSKKENIKKIYSHPQGFSQCKNWIKKNYPHTELIETISTSDAAQKASKEKNSAAIASKLAAQKFMLNIIEIDVTDSNENTTRFVSVSLKQNPSEKMEKSSIIFGIKNQPGSLFNSLEAFKLFNVNMTKLESRPSMKKSWEYLFFVDFEGNFSEEKVKNALSKVKDNASDIKVLGSYCALNTKLGEEIKKKISLAELRTKIDQLNEKIISGLKERSKYPLNKEIYMHEFLEEKEWLLHRLKKEQTKESDSPQIDKSEEILHAYEWIIQEICPQKEDKNTYGETAKLDVANVLAINERVLSLGKQVAEYKMQREAKIINEENAQIIRKRLVDLTREKQVIDYAEQTAKKYGLRDTKLVGEFVQKIINITTDTEVEYILKKRKK